MLSCNAISRARWEKPLFKELGFCLMPGALLAVLGVNPGAKTAFLRVLAGELAPARGEIRFNNRPIQGDAAYAANRIYLGPAAPLHRKASVTELLFDSSAAGQTTALVPAALKYFGLESHANDTAATLPEHLRVRLRLARLIATPRPLWFLDAAALPPDDEGKGLLYALIANRCNRDGIVVMAADRPDFITPVMAIDLDDFR